MAKRQGLRPTTAKKPTTATAAAGTENNTAEEAKSDEMKRPITAKIPTAVNRVSHFKPKKYTREDITTTASVENVQHIADRYDAFGAEWAEEPKPSEAV